MAIFQFAMLNYHNSVYIYISIYVQMYLYAHTSTFYTCICTCTCIYFIYIYCRCNTYHIYIQLCMHIELSCTAFLILFLKKNASNDPSQRAPRTWQGCTTPWCWWEHGVGTWKIVYLWDLTSTKSCISYSYTWNFMDFRWYFREYFMEYNQKYYVRYNDYWVPGNQTWLGNPGTSCQRLLDNPLVISGWWYTYPSEKY